MSIRDDITLAVKDINQKLQAGHSLAQEDQLTLFLISLLEEESAE